jgi:hypothetical protein
MTVPYDRLSQALQGIHRLSGKVASVTMASVAAPASAPAPVSNPAPTAAPAVTAARAAELPPEQKSRSPKPKRKQRR